MPFAAGPSTPACVLEPTAPVPVDPYLFGVNTLLGPIENLPFEDPALLRAPSTLGAGALRWPGGSVANYWSIADGRYDDHAKSGGLGQAYADIWGPRTAWAPRGTFGPRQFWDGVGSASAGASQAAACRRPAPEPGPGRMPCDNRTLKLELGAAVAGVCGDRSCAPLDARGSSLYCHQLPPGICESHAVKLAFVLHACRTTKDALSGMQCKLGPKCTESSSSAEHSKQARWRSRDAARLRRSKHGPSQRRERQAERRVRPRLPGTMSSIRQDSQPSRAMARPNGDAPPRWRAVAEAAETAECGMLATIPALFIVALGRTGSSSLVRLLNAIPGYRISGETDNAWMHLYRHARARAEPYIGVGVEKAPLRLLRETPVCEGWAPWGDRASARAQRLRAECEEAQKDGRWSRRLTCKRAIEAARDAERCHQTSTALRLVCTGRH